MTASTESLYLFIIITKTQIARFIEFSIDFSITSTNLIVLIAFKSSHFHKHTRMSFTFSSSSSQISTLKHQKSHRKSYFIMNDLFEMFVEKSSKRNMNIIQKKSIFSCSSEFRQSRQIRIKSIDSQENLKDSTMFAKKQFKKKWNIIHKRMRSSMLDQTQIINYFKFVDQSNSTSINSRKFSLFINCLCSTFRFCFSVNRIAETPQHQHIAIDEASSLETQQKFKSDVFISNLNSTSRICSSVNQDARTSHIALDKTLSSTSCRSFKFFKFAVFINSLNSALRFSCRRESIFFAL